MRGMRQVTVSTWCAVDLCAEAIRLGRLLAQLMPGELELQ